MKLQTARPQRKISANLAGAVLAVLAAIFFSFLNLAIRFSEAHLSVWHMMFGRSLFAVVFLLAAARLGGLSLKGRRQSVLLLQGLTGTAGILCLTYALLTIPLFQALILFYTYPAVAALISPLLARDRICRRDWICIGLAFFGTVLILWSGHSQGFAVSLGHAAALGASAGLGLTMTLIRRLSPENNALTPLFYISAVGCLACFLPLIASSSGILVSTAGLWWLGAIGLLAVLAHVASNQALSFIPSPRVGIISMLEVLFGAVYGYLLFAETLGWSTLFGGTLVVVAAVGLIRGSES